MTDSNFRGFADTLDDLARDIVRACRRALRAVGAMPWPAVMVCCVLLAALISILPLALCLFVLFLGLKLIAGAFIVERRRTDLHKD